MSELAARHKGKSREVQSRSHHIASDLVVTELAEAGFNVVDRIDNFAEIPADHAADVLWRIIAVPANGR
jgi:hypothetical protein